MQPSTTTLLGDLEPGTGRHLYAVDSTTPLDRHWGAPVADHTAAAPPVAPAPLPRRQRRIAPVPPAAPAQRAALHTAGANEHAAVDLVTDRLITLGESTPVVLIMVDIDHLGDINRAHGLAVGDEVVAGVADRITSLLRTDDLVVRAGGDRFVVLRACPGRDAGATRLAERIRRSLAEHIIVAGRRLTVTAGIGFTIDRPSVFDPQRTSRQRAVDLLTQSHEALRDAKRHGPGNVVRYQHDTADELHDHPVTVTAALRRGELSVDFQPIFCPGTGDTLGAKTLLRWHHPTDGVLDADQFMPAVADDHGIELRDWILDEACAATRRWLDERVVAADFAIHVDIAGIDIGEPTFVDRVAAILSDHRMRPHQLVLEVNEHHLARRDANGVGSAIRDLRRKGVKIAIDNFRMGSGAQSLATTVGADILRLDTGGTLTNDNDADTDVAHGLVALAHGLGMQVVAEGVKGVEQLRRLRTAGCDLVHGALLTAAA